MKGLTRDTTLSGPVYLSKVSSIIVHSLYPNIENLRILEIGRKYKNILARDHH